MDRIKLNKEHSDSFTGEDLTTLSEVTKGAGITLGGNMAGKALLFLYTLFLARVLGASELGLYFLGITIVRFLAILSIAGLDVGVVRYVAIYRGRNDVCRMKGTVLISASISFVISLVCAGLFYVLGDLVASLIFQKPEFGVVIKYLSFSIPFEVLMRIFLASTRGLKHMQYVVYTENLSWVGLRFLLAVCLALGLKLGLMGVVLAYVLSSVVAAGLGFYFSNKFIPLLDSKSKPIYEMKNLVNFSIPMAFTLLLHDLMIHVDILMLGLFISAAGVGIYSVAVRLITLAQVFFMAFQPIFQPYIAELHDKKDVRRLSKLLKTLTHWSVSISFPVFLVLFFAPEFFLQFFGNDFIKGSGCLSVLVFAIILSSISTLPASMIFMAGRSDLSLKNNLGVLIINVILNYLLIPRFGILGAAFATGMSFVFLSIIRIVEVYMLMKMQPFSLAMWKPLIAGAGALSSMWLIQKSSSIQNHMFMPAILLLFFALYFSLLILFRLDDEQIYIKDIVKSKIVSFINKSF